MEEKILKKAQAAINDGTIYWGLVSRLGKAEDVPYMEVPVSGFDQVGVIYKNEVDAEIERKSLLPLLGQKVPFVIVGVEEKSGKLLCSRKQAQEKIKCEMANDLANGEVLHGVVVHTAPYGVCIETNGISGLMKNSDYLSIAIPVSDFLSAGDKIDVVCKAISVSGRIQWKPAVRPEPVTIDYDVEEDTVVLGSVTNMCPFESGGIGVFVRIGKGLDALCLLPPDMELDVGSKVSIHVVSVEAGKGVGMPPRVRGKILRAID